MRIVLQERVGSLQGNRQEIDERWKLGAVSSPLLSKEVFCRNLLYLLNLLFETSFMLSELLLRPLF